MKEENKSEYQKKIQKSRDNLSSLMKKGEENKIIKNYNTHDLFLYIQNFNSHSKNNQNNVNCSYDKIKRKKTEYSNVKSKYLDISPLKLGINTETNNNNNKYNKKGKQNIKILIDIIDSNNNEENNKNFNKNKGTNQKRNNKIKSKKNNQNISNDELKYINTEIFNSTNDSNYFLKNNNLIAQSRDENRDNRPISGQMLNKRYKNKNKVNNLILNCSNNNFLENSSKIFPNNKTPLNFTNNYFKIKNMNLHFLNEVNHSSTEINVLTNHNNNDESSKKLKKI